MSDEMRHVLTWRNGWFLAVISGFLVLLFTSVPVTTQSNAVDAASVPPFMRANRCYRFTFPVAGAPNWKVLELLEAGWIKAEADAGPASALREPAWINTAQIISAREARCSE